MHLSRYLKIYPYREKADYCLFYSTKKTSIILLHESTLRSINDGSVSTSDEDTLSELGFLVPDVDKEKEEMLRFFDKLNDRKKLNAMLVMNLDCNLGCRYCYEEGIKGKLYMSAETAELLLDFLERHYLSHGKTVHLD